jgi:ubiquinone/menaquinone biosynthesis C-methylase UbiE
MSTRADLTAESTSQRQTVRHHFDASTRGWEDIYRVRRPRRGTEQNFLSRLKHVQTLISDCRGALLDVGCGTAMTTINLYHPGVTSICGIDFAPRMIDRAERNAGQVSLSVPVEFRVASAEATGLPSESFDVITALGLLEYLDDPAAFLSEVTRVARRGAVIVITTPNRLSPVRLIDTTIERTLRSARRFLKGRSEGPSSPSDATRIRHTPYSRRELSRISERVGLTLEKHLYCTISSYYIERLLPIGGPLTRLLDQVADRTWLSWPTTNLIVRLRKR